jgi:hypothetical protein
MQRLVFGFTVLGFLSGIAERAMADFITNGSFENTANFVPIAGDDAMSLNPGATNITGWTVINAELAWIGPSNPFRVSASDGQYFLDLTGYHDSSPYGGITQTISTTPGATYALSFDLGSTILYNANGTAGITATAGSTTQNFFFTTNLTNAWQNETMSFTAASNSTEIKLIGLSADPSHIGLDNVSVSQSAPAPTPVPSSLAMLAGAAAVGGIGAVVRRARRRKKRNTN